MKLAAPGASSGDNTPVEKSPLCTNGEFFKSIFKSELFGFMWLLFL